MRLQTLDFLRYFIWFCVLLNVLHWFSVRHVQSRWTNVPPPPSVLGASSSALGDQQLAYRMIGIMLQNFGDTGGMTTSLKDYDFTNLAGWFFLTKKLDHKSDFIPYLAAFYFGGADVSEELRPVVDYLHDIGKNPEDEKWRWLGQAVFLARYKLKDYDYAYAMAQELAALPIENMPMWARNMPALVKAQAGEKEAALAILLELLKSSADKMHPNEVNATVGYICERLLDAEEAKRHPLCQNFP